MPPIQLFVLLSAYGTLLLLPFGLGIFSAKRLLQHKQESLLATIGLYLLLGLPLPYLVSAEAARLLHIPEQLLWWCMLIATALWTVLGTSFALGVFLVKWYLKHQTVPRTMALCLYILVGLVLSGSGLAATAHLLQVTGLYGCSYF